MWLLKKKSEKKSVRKYIVEICMGIHHDGMKTTTRLQIFSHRVQKFLIMYFEQQGVLQSIICMVEVMQSYCKNSYFNPLCM